MRDCGKLFRPGHHHYHHHHSQFCSISMSAMCSTQTLHSINKSVIEIILFVLLTAAILDMGGSVLLTWHRVNVFVGLEWLYLNHRAPVITIRLCNPFVFFCWVDCCRRSHCTHTFHALEQNAGAWHRKPRVARNRIHCLPKPTGMEQKKSEIARIFVYVCRHVPHRTNGLN